MTITQAMAVAVATGCTAVGLASPAWAEDGLDGAYILVNGATTNGWTVTTHCNDERSCGGTVSTSTGWVGAINRVAGGPWTAERHDVPNGFTGPDGSSGPADLVYSFDPTSLAGTVTSTSKPGTCNDPAPRQDQQPVSLQPGSDESTALPPFLRSWTPIAAGLPPP
jgi:hypothetical protein